MVKGSKKKLREYIEKQVSHERFTLKKDGTVVFRRGYFYPHGMTAEKYEEVIEKCFPKFGIVILSSRDNWAPWPRDSYFEVVARIKMPGEGL